MSTPSALFPHTQIYTSSHFEGPPSPPSSTQLRWYHALPSTSSCSKFLPGPASSCSPLLKVDFLQKGEYLLSQGLQCGSSLHLIAMSSRKKENQFGIGTLGLLPVAGEPGAGSPTLQSCCLGLVLESEGKRWNQLVGNPGIQAVRVVKEWGLGGQGTPVHASGVMNSQLTSCVVSSKSLPLSGPECSQL